jgi:membrane protein implicated in regulation of membrane protease activity
MTKNWNKIWRYIHLSLGLILVVYHARIAYYHQGMFGVTTLWSEETDKFVSMYFIFFVMWTGLAKWPIYPWYKKRQNRKKREAKETSLVTE